MNRWDEMGWDHIETSRDGHKYIAVIHSSDYSVSVGSEMLRAVSSSVDRSMASQGVLEAYRCGKLKN